MTRRVQAQQPGEQLGPLDVNGEIVYDCDAISDGVAVSVRTQSLSRKSPRTDWSQHHMQSVRSRAQPIGLGDYSALVAYVLS